MGFLVLRTEQNVNQVSWLMTQKHALIRGRKEREGKKPGKEGQEGEKELEIMDGTTKLNI